jgi:hypothetical protein
LSTRNGRRDPSSRSLANRSNPSSLLSFWLIINLPQVAFSIFFQGHAVASSNSANANNGNPHYLDNSSFDTNCSSASGGGSSFGSRMSYACVPTNTPATPPAFPDTLAAFSQLKASSPDQRSTGFESRIVHLQKT